MTINSNEFSLENQRALEELAWAIEASQGQFSLFLARCNYRSLQKRLSQQLQQICSVSIWNLELNKSDTTLYNWIQAELGEEKPDALMVFHLEIVDDLEHLLISTNQVREEFQKNFRFPLVLWVNDRVLQQITRVAPDFESWGTITEFAISQNELALSIAQTANKWFNNQLILTRQESLDLQAELEAAQRDFHICRSDFKPELEANLESLLATIKFNNGNTDESLAHYQKAVQLWQKVDNLQRQGKVLSEIAYYYYHKSLQYRELDHPDWQNAKRYIQQSLAAFEAANRPDLVANSLLGFGIILRRLQDWEQLETLAEKALQLHEAENKPLEMAQDYGFLAEVAVVRKNWIEAKGLAEQALQILTEFTVASDNISPNLDRQVKESVISYNFSRYKFILANAQENLGQVQEAILNLEAAKGVGSPEYDTQLYIDILNNLCRLYYQNKQYLKAFEIKLERQSIEQQYGLRAFIGAGRIQPQKTAKLTLNQVDKQEEVALEIEASGRHLDVKELIKRIGQNDYKLIVIHGQSGVGKSSLVNGGLVPALKQKPIGKDEVLPVLMRVYTNWMAELGRLLAEGLREKGIEDEEISRLTSPPAPLLRGEGSEEGSNVTTTTLEADILAQLEKSESRNLRTVLIFDQFEEFFFVYPNPIERQQFFNFLGKCLNVLPVKVILSLREDYLHYLLACNRMDSMKIIGKDILSKNVLYPLGNFLPDATKTIIQDLARRSKFPLDSALIEELVHDLSKELGEVRPIELQVVGAQLQSENITTLAEYQERGPKEKLVNRYLQEVVRDCGEKNHQIAEIILYLLTDEKGTRPLRTRDELERDLQTLAKDLNAEVRQLNLVLQVFVGSGLVVLLPEQPDDRYQLVHDYLAGFIRQQQEPKLKMLMAELEQERKQRKVSEEKLNRFLKRALMGSIAAVFGFAALAVGALGLAWRAEEQRKRAEISQIEAITNSSERLFVSSQTFNALIESLKAAGKLKQAVWATDETKAKVLAVLEPAVYGVKELNGWEAHIDYVNSVSFSPDGQIIASASGDNTVKLWNRQGQLLQTLSEHTNAVTSVSFSPDGQTIASASRDKTVKLWNRQGQLLQTLSGHSSTVWSVSFSPDGQTIASASADKTVKLWNRQGKLLQTFSGHSDSVRSVSFSPDGQTIASASDDKTVKLWNRQGQLLQTLSGHRNDVRSVSFSPDGQTIASASRDKTVKLWNRQGQLLQTLSGHRSYVNSVSFSPDGQTIASASADKTVKLWNQEDKEFPTITGHSSTVWSVSFSPDGQTIASASDDYSVILWRRDVDINTLVKYGCNWLNDYLITHPETLEELQECHSPSLLRQASLVLVKEGEQLATKGDIDAATAKFSQAKQWNPSFNFNPKAKAKDIADKANAQRLLSEGKQLVKEGNAEGAMAKFQAALELDSSLNFNPQAKVQEITIEEEAQKLISKGNEQAKLGDIKGAIAYFQQALKVNSSLKFNPTSKAQQLAKAEAKRLVSEGKNMAKSGNIKDATSNFQKALKLDPSLKFNPEIELRKNQAIGLVINGENLAKDGKVKEAIAAYAQAQKLDPKVKISADSWGNSLCWYGSLHGYPSNVMFACEKAVALAPKNILMRDNRGLVRALTGNRKGAISDFQVYIAQTDNQEEKLQRQRWVNDLKAGKNPFTPEELKRLLEDGF